MKRLATGFAHDGLRTTTICEQQRADELVLNILSGQFLARRATSQRVAEVTRSANFAKDELKVTIEVVQYFS